MIKALASNYGTYFLALALSLGFMLGLPAGYMHSKGCDSTTGKEQMAINAQFLIQQCEAGLTPMVQFADGSQTFCLQSSLLDQQDAEVQQWD